jgi:hypothetical protein
MYPVKILLTSVSFVPLPLQPKGLDAQCATQTKLGVLVTVIDLYVENVGRYLRNELRTLVCIL